MKNKIQYNTFTIWVVFYAVLPINCLLSQQSLVTKQDSIFKIAAKMWKSNPQKSYDLLMELNNTIEKNDTITKNKILYYLGVTYTNLMKYDSSELYLNKYLDFVQTTKDTPRLAAVYDSKARLYTNQGLFAQAYETTLKALKYFEYAKDTNRIIYSNSDLGELLSFLHKEKEAYSYYLNSMKLAVERNDSVLIELTNRRFGKYFISQKNIDSAIICLKKAETYSSGLKNKMNTAFNQYHMARAYREAQNYDTALIYVDQVNSAISNSDSILLFIANQVLKGGLLNDLKKYKEAIQLLESIKEIGPKKLTRGVKEQVYEFLYPAYIWTDKKELALEAIDSLISINEELKSEESINHVMSLEVAYQTERKEREIDNLKLSKKLNEAQIKSDKLIRNGLIAGLLILLTSLFIIYNLYLRTNKQKKLIDKSLSEKNILLKEIHHRVKNNLQFISSLLNLQSKHLQDAKALSALKEGQNRVKSMALIHQNLYQNENLLGIESKAYLDALIQNLFTTYNISPEKITIKKQIDSVHIDVDTMIPIGLILNELISNSLKYAFPDQKQGQIDLILKNNKTSIILEVQDNGIGIPTTDISQLGGSFGYRLIQSLVRQLNAFLSIENKNGTLVKLEIPLLSPRKTNSVS